jgi:hypothetical protein
VFAALYVASRPFASRVDLFQPPAAPGFIARW